MGPGRDDSLEARAAADPGSGPEATRQERTRPSPVTPSRADDHPGGATPDGDGSGQADSREALRTLEERLIRQRRALIDVPTDGPTVGLALSGGGIRSATFCLGLLRGLAQNGLLTRFDYLSTVSGGGYVGAAFGRMVCALGIVEAQERFARSDSLLLGWLRRNGRYLAPKGARDYGLAIATYLRSGVAIHAELGLLSMLLACVVILPHALHLQWLLLDSVAWSAWPTVWWPLAAFWWLVFAPSALVSYWSLRDATLGRHATRERNRPDARHWITLDLRDAITLALVVALVLWIALSNRMFVRPAMPLGPPTGVLILVLVMGGIALRSLALHARLLATHKKAAVAFGEQRDRLTRIARRHNNIFAVMMGLGLLDMLSWHCVRLLEGGQFWWFGGLGFSGVVVVLVRTLSDPLQKLMTSMDSANSRLMPKLLNIIGMVAAAMLVVAWATLVQWLVFGDLRDLPDLPDRIVQPLRMLGAITVALLAWLLLTFWNRDMPNATSLHGFYRARLTRAYLGVGNTRRFGEKLDGTDVVGDHPQAAVTQFMEGDDVDLVDYAPEEKGGPIHLIATCLNQTRSDRTGLYNADRKGVPLVASARGIEVGSDVHALDCARLGTLGRWVSVSGAAASPGAGSYTTTGWALLLFLAGARLGLWFWPGLGNPKEGGGLRAWAGRSLEVLRTSKFGLLQTEAMASFGGPQRSAWYLSDGGHFENTGVHALLRREVDVIVLADCGADPRFEFGDLENLVRKARIDYDADIEFYTGEAGNALFDAPDTRLTVLSPERMVDNRSARGVLLARICYHRSDARRCKYGTLVVVKPNLHEALDSDVLAYARREQDFPQQSTGDQFFDEAQWESYHRLGEDFGRAMDEHWLAQLPGFGASVFAAEPPAPLRCLQPLVSATVPADTLPIWRRHPRTAAVGATLSIGALAALVLPAWQAVSSVRKEREEERSTYNALVQRMESEYQEGKGKPGGNGKQGGSEGWDGPGAAMRAIYERVRQRPGERGTSLIRSVQYDCGISAPVGKIGARCPYTQHSQNVAGLCHSVCDEVPDYWEPSDSLSQRLARGEPPESPLESAQASASGPGPAPGLRHPEDASARATPDHDIDSVGPVEDHDQVAASHAHVVIARAQSPSDAASTTARSPVAVRHADGTAVAKPALHADASSIERPGEVPPPASRRDETGLSACDHGKLPVDLYVQIYSEGDRSWLQAVLERTLKNGPVKPQGIENVVRTSVSKGTRPPEMWPQPTLLINRFENSTECAQALRQRLQASDEHLRGIVVLELPRLLRTQRRAIEFWVPPQRQATAE